MITRHESEKASSRPDVSSRLAEPVDQSRIYWRQDGKVIKRGEKFVARFVAYIDANTVRERLDAVVPGDWDLTLELLPPFTTADGDGVDTSACSFKARLQILGCIREDVGSGRDYKAASTDAFKRAAVRFGIGHELYDYEQNWVEVDGDGRYPKPLEDPGVVYARRYGRPAPNGNGGNGGESRAEGQVGNHGQDNGRESTPTHVGGEQSSSPRGAADAPADLPVCPTCGGRMWDNRLSKRNPKAPDFKCRDRSCDGVIWPAASKGNGNGRKRGGEREAVSIGAMPQLDGPVPSDEDFPGALGDVDDDLPF